ncbi:MAG: fumarylacetoacetate hydrolase family protein [Alphaproteobacteria bacterium]|nr:fumarylacetoacetate hydrolase family protein [Alphaproteobacteria bacterium]
MKLLSFRAEGRALYGAVVGEGVVDLADRVGDRYPTLRTALAGGALAELDRIARGAPPDYALRDIAYDPVVPAPDKILCVGLNYRTHAAEMARELPANPSVFARLHNTLAAHGDTLPRPRVSTHFDFEGELAVIIGRGGRHIRAEDALKHVAGYTCFLDGSVRDFQKHSVTAGKNFPRTGPLGPWMATADEIPDPTTLTLVTRLNGTEVQRDTVDHLIYPIPTLIQYLSTITPLEPGDIIATGTPHGVGAGRTPPLWMKAGDVIEVDISNIGVLRNAVVDET